MNWRAEIECVRGEEEVGMAKFLTEFSVSATSAPMLMNMSIIEFSGTSRMRSWAGELTRPAIVQPVELSEQTSFAETSNQLYKQ